MFKLIYRNLIARRGRYCWIFIELCLVALIAWAVLDSPIVNLYKINMSQGYDIDRLVTFNLAEFPDTDEEADDDKDKEVAFSHINRILERVRSDSRVESATIVNQCSPLRGSVSINSIPSGAENEDGLYYVVHFWPGTDFFKTFGITDAYGSGDKTYEETSMSGRELVVSKSLAEYLFPDEKAMGHFLEEKDQHCPPEKLSPIVGVVNDIVYRPNFALTPIVYKTRKVKDIDVGSTYPVIRLKPGVDADRFVEDYSPVVVKELRSGNIYSHSLQSYQDMKEQMSRDMTNENFTCMSIALFFFFNILLCMVGTFYLQTRKRSEETGVMRTFGASRGFIIREMLGEGFVMTTLSWLLGCLLYWLYIKDEGLPALGATFHDAPSQSLPQMFPNWIDDFATHFSIVSLIIYAIMLLCVLLGIYIPARKISRVNPVDALRDE